MLGLRWVTNFPNRSGLESLILISITLSLSISKCNFTCHLWHSLKWRSKLRNFVSYVFFLLWNFPLNVPGSFRISNYFQSQLFHTTAMSVFKFVLHLILVCVNHWNYDEHVAHWMFDERTNRFRYNSRTSVASISYGWFAIKRNHYYIRKFFIK